MFTESVVGIDFDNGYYTVVLGEDVTNNALDSSVFADATDTLYLGMAIDAGPELPNRMALNAVPSAAFAHHATQADSAADADFATAAGTATTATNLSGGTVDATSIAVNGVPLVDTTLDEAAVDGFVANNGYALSTDLATVATTGSYADLSDIPADLADGDDVNTYTGSAPIVVTGTDISLDEAAVVAALDDDFVSDADAFTAADAHTAMESLDGGRIHFGGGVSGLPTNYTAGFHSSDGADIFAGHNTGGETSSLFIVTRDNTNDSVYIGGGGSQCCGSPQWRGLRVFANGNAQLSGNMASGVGSHYSDVAENVPASMNVGAGDVVAVPASAGTYGETGFVLASEPYQASTVGVITDSATMTMASPEGRQPLALTGLVKVKVDARYGRIRPGDLLTSSATPGHAMRARKDVPGTIIGKALEPLDDGTGRVLMLVMNR